MRWQLSVFSLFVLVGFLKWQLALWLAQRPARRRGGLGARGGPSFAERIEAAMRDTLWTYVPFAAVALLMLSHGKPDLLPQWVGWAVVALQICKNAAIFLTWETVQRALGLLIIAGLAYLWIIQLPVFDTPAY